MAARADEGILASAPASSAAGLQAAAKTAGADEAGQLGGSDSARSGYDIKETKMNDDMVPGLRVQTGV